MASILVNGTRGQQKCDRLLVDEALMNHFGAVILAARITGASEIYMIGDIKHLPFRDRNNHFPLKYAKPSAIIAIDRDLLCTHRSPMDVAYALNEIYNGIYSSRPKIRSLEIKNFTGAQIPKTSQNTLFLTHTQEEKTTLTNQGFGRGIGSRVLTIHEAQGLTYESVVIVRASPKRLRLHDSVPHAVVALTRHTVECVYYTDDREGATEKLIKKAIGRTTKELVEYNLQMAIRGRDAAVMEALLRIVRQV